MRTMISGLLLTVAVALPVMAQAADPRDRGEGRMGAREQIERAPDAEPSRRAAIAVREEVRESRREVQESRRDVQESRRDVQDSRRDLQDSRRELRQDRADPSTSPAELRADRRDVRRDERELIRDRVELREDRRDLRDSWRSADRGDHRRDRYEDRRDHRDYRHRDRYDWRWDRVRWGRYDDRGWSFRYSTPSWSSYWTPFGFGYGDRLTISWGLRWYDRDRDGRLTDREWRRAQAAFYRFADRNRDGYVSYREYDWAVDAIRYNRYGYGYAFDY